MRQTYRKYECCADVAQRRRQLRSWWKYHANTMYDRGAQGLRGWYADMQTFYTFQQNGYDCPQLFNLEQDSQEIHDLAQEPQHAEICAKLMAINPSGWSGEKITLALEQEAQRWQILTDWALP